MTHWTSPSTLARYDDRVGHGHRQRQQRAGKTLGSHFEKHEVSRSHLRQQPLRRRVWGSEGEGVWNVTVPRLPGHLGVDTGAFPTSSTWTHSGRLPRLGRTRPRVVRVLSRLPIYIEDCRLTIPKSVKTWSTVLPSDLHWNRRQRCSSFDRLQLYDPWERGRRRPTVTEGRV